MSDLAGTSALITDIERRKALPIIRALGKEHVRVIGISSQRLPMGQFSRYCQKVYQCPDYRYSPDKFLSALEEICAREKPDVLYPLEDVTVSLCVNAPERWTPYTNALLPGMAALDTASDKWKTLQAAMELGIPVPKSFCPESMEELEEIAAEWSQWVIKPRKSSGSRGIRYVNSGHEIAAAYQEVSLHYPRPIVQERIPQTGTGVGVFLLLDRDMSVLAVFCHRRLREYPVSGGPSTLRESFRDNALIEQSINLARKIGCAGVSMVEYKYDPRTGHYVLMEVNPRFWGSLQLAIHSGVNFPVLYQMATLGKLVQPVLEYPSGMMCRWLWPGDILHFLSNPDRWQMKPGFFRFRQPNLAYDIISRDDPWPMLGILLEALRKLWNRER